MRRVVAATVRGGAMGSVLLIAACGGADEPADSISGGAVATEPSTAAGSAHAMPEMDAEVPFDAIFIDSMVEHHRGAIAMAKQVDLLLVVGAHNSSNSNRLREIGENFGIPSHLIEDARMFDPVWLDGVSTVGLTAGASAPETLVQNTIARIRQYFDVTVETLDGVEENIHFKLPKELSDVERPKDAMKAWAVGSV